MVSSILGARTRRYRTREKYSHYEIKIEQKIEIPTFLDHRVPQDVFELDGVDIVMVCDIANPGKLKGRRDECQRIVNLLVPLSNSDWTFTSLMDLGRLK